MRLILVVAVLNLFAGLPLSAQSAQATNNILFRTVMVKTSKDFGTMFSIEVDSREYWLTAKHVLTGAKHPPFGSITTKQISVSVLDPFAVEIKWTPFDFSVIDPGKDIDIVVLAPKHSIQFFPIGTLPIKSDAPVGGECEFLGFPFANFSMNKLPDGRWYRLPFIKHCYLSGSTEAPSPVWILDGINNEGFSGGPVVVNTGPNQHLIGVVSGYQSENSDVISVPDHPAPDRKPTSSKPQAKAKAKTKNVVQTNTGLVFAFDASVALDAIKKNPIGPVVGGN
jgi:hypothetical protein